MSDDEACIILVGADKGGVGKTTISRALLDYFVVHNIPTRAFDTGGAEGHAAAVSSGDYRGGRHQLDRRPNESF